MPQINVTVDGPDGLPDPEHVSIFYKPRTAGEFDALVEASGGPAEFMACSNFVTCGAGTTTIYIYEPTAEAPPLEPTRPFINAFKSRITEARDAQRAVAQMT